MAPLQVTLCVALVVAVAGDAAPGQSYHYQYGDEPPPYSAPGYHWYRYSYGGTVAPRHTASRHTTGYAKGFGYTGLSGKPYVKVYDYDSRRRNHGHGHGDHSRGYARDYAYDQRQGDFRYVREYYNDLYHHTRQNERYYPDRHRPQYPGRGEAYGAARRPHTVVVLGSKKAPRGNYAGGYHGDGGFRRGAGASDYHRNYYGGGGFQSILRGDSYRRGDGIRYYGGGGHASGTESYRGHGYRHHGGFNDGGVIGGLGEKLSGYHRDDYRHDHHRNYHRDDYRHDHHRNYHQEDYHQGDYHRNGYNFGTSGYNSGSKGYYSRGWDNTSGIDGHQSGGGDRSGGSSYHSGSGYRGDYGDNDGFVSLSSGRRPAYHSYIGNDDRHYRVSHHRKIYYK